MMTVILIGAPNFVWPIRGKFQHISDDMDKTRCGKNVMGSWSRGYVDNVSRCPKCGDFVEWELARQTRKEALHDLIRTITEAIQDALGENVEAQLNFKPGGSSARVIIQTAKGPKLKT